MALILTFVLGILNFALHRAVLDRRMAILARMGWPPWAGRASLLAEFAVLLGALLLVHSGPAGGDASWSWFYGGYTVVNGVGAWLMLKGRA